MGVVTDASWIEKQYITEHHYIDGSGFEMPETTNSKNRIFSDEVRLAVDLKKGYINRIRIKGDRHEDPKRN